MKSKTCLLMLAFATLSVPVFADKGDLGGNDPGGGGITGNPLLRDKGDLGGNDPGGGGITGNPLPSPRTSINIFLKQGESIDIQFKEDIGTVCATITEAYGMTISNETVDTSVTSRLSMNIFGLQPGKYTIVITAQNGAIIGRSMFTVQ